MAKKIYRVNLTKDERNQLTVYIRSGKKSARSITRARILLLSHEGRSGADIAAALGTSLPTVYRVRQRYRAGGLEKALKEDPRPGAPVKVDTRLQAHIIALCCSDPPKGHAKRTLRLLADRLVQLEFVDTIHYTTVRNILKKRA